MEEFSKKSFFEMDKVIFSFACYFFQKGMRVVFLIDKDIIRFA